MRDNFASLQERMFCFAVRIVQFVDTLPNTPVGRHTGGQLLRSGTSSAANYEEACSAESRADFIHKLSISLKELRESRFWIRLTLAAQTKNEGANQALLQEVDELCRIIASSIVTAKSNTRKQKQTESV